MTINELFKSEDWATLWTNEEKNNVLSTMLLPYYSTTDSNLTNQYLTNLVNLFNDLFNNWVALMGDEDLVITDKNQVLNIIKSQFKKWILKNGVKIKMNYDSILLAVNDEYSTNRTYTINKTLNGNTTFKEGYSGGGLSNQQGTKQSNSETNSQSETGTDTDKYSQTDTLRKLNYIQLLKPFDFDNYFKDLEEILLVIIWS